MIQIATADLDKLCLQERQVVPSSQFLRLLHFLIYGCATFFGKFEISTASSVTLYRIWGIKRPGTPFFDEAEDESWIEALPLFGLENELRELATSDSVVG
jgi:hypothetical protein